MMVTSITPAEGLTTGRRLVAIRGAGFRIADPEPGATSWRRTVGVWFDGVAADEVVPLAHYRLAVVVPEYRGDPADLPAVVGVRVANLDDGGAPIPGEDVTIADCFTYRRGDLTLEGDLVAITRAVVRQLRRAIIQNVTTSADPDYSAEPASGMTAIAQLPVVILEGPKISKADGVYLDNESEELPEDSQGVISTVAPPFTAAITWDIIANADRKIEALNLVNLIIRTFDRRPWIRIPYRSASGVVTDVQVDAKIVGDFKSTDRFGDRIHTFEAALRVEPVQLGDGYGLARGGAPVDGVVSLETPATDALELEVEGQ